MHEFVVAEGLTCLIKVGAEADQNYQNYILRGTSTGERRTFSPINSQNTFPLSHTWIYNSCANRGCYSSMLSHCFSAINPPAPVFRYITLIDVSAWWPSRAQTLKAYKQTQMCATDNVEAGPGSTAGEFIRPMSARWKITCAEVGERQGAARGPKGRGVHNAPSNVTTI